MKTANVERNLVLIFTGAILLLIAGTAFLATPNDDTNKSPTTYNSGTAGIKAAYLLLANLGYTTTRWEQPTAALSTLDAANTTLIFAEPNVPLDMSQGNLDALRNDIAGFLNRGGRVLVTGYGAEKLLPDASLTGSRQTFGKVCLTTPEGRSPLARAGQVSINNEGRWNNLTPAVHVEQWCGADAVVVSYRVGAGTALWWSSVLPLTNRGLKDDASLKLLLASIDNSAATPSARPYRQVFFDEYFHGVETTISDLTHGLPLAQIAWQVGAVGLLLIFSFSRRSGPIRIPARVPRTSPIEFAESMGQLYRKAGATQAATESARQRVLAFLTDRCGLPRVIVRGEPARIAEALHARFDGEWTALAQHLTQAAEAQYRSIAPRSALTLVQALDRDLASLAAITRRPKHSS